MAGPKFGEWEFQVVVLMRSIYGLNTSVDRCNKSLSDKINMSVFRNSKSDSDLWMLDYGYEYVYITIYSDKLLVFLKDPIVILRVLNILFPLKEVIEP